VNVVEAPVSGGKLDEAVLAKAGDDFEAAYERIFGKGAGHREAGIELTEIRIRAVGRQAKPDLATSAAESAKPAEAAAAGTRRAWDAAVGEFTEFDVWRGAELRSGNRIAGPAIVELAETTVALHRGDHLEVDEFGNFVCEREESA
jgi:N-methylhydantoinase A